MARPKPLQVNSAGVLSFSRKSWTIFLTSSTHSWTASLDLAIYSTTSMDICHEVITCATAISCFSSICTGPIAPTTRSSSSCSYSTISIFLYCCFLRLLTLYCNVFNSMSFLICSKGERVFSDPLSFSILYFDALNLSVILCNST